MDNIIINIAKDFSRSPGARYKEEGDFPGVEFRSNLLAPNLKKAIENGVKIEVNLDGSAGYSTAFLEESFGGLIREDGFTYDEVMNNIIFTSDEDPSYIDDIKHYIEHAWEHR